MSRSPGGGDLRIGRPALGAWLLVAAALVTACGGSELPVGAEKIGDYAVRQTPEGLEVRSLPDQHPGLNRLLGWLHPGFAKIGLPSVALSPTRILEHGALGTETEWPRKEVASVAVQNRVPRGVEAKSELLDRSWRVLLLRTDGQPLRSGFGFAREADARAMAALVGRALSLPPQDIGHDEAGPGE